MGEPALLDDAEMEELLEFFKGYGQRGVDPGWLLVSKFGRNEFFRPEADHQGKRCDGLVIGLNGR